MTGTMVRHQKVGRAGVLDPQMEVASAQRIRVRQGGECVPLAPGPPTLSSAHSPWKGALLERHTHGPYSTETHQHLSYFLSLHLSEPTPLVWRSRGQDGSRVFEPGSMVLLSRGTEDAVSFPGPVERILLNLNPSILRLAFPEDDTDAELVDHWRMRDPQIEYILRALEADLEAGIPSGRLFGQSLLNALAVHLRLRYGVHPPKEVKPQNGLPRARLKRVLEYVEANLEQEIALAALADTAGMSPHYFSELFKQSLGLPPHQYVLRRRIERARELLRDSRITVFEAAVRTGFSDQSHFTRIFRRIVGITPTQYRATI